ncbi:Steroidogenic acute regulatory protein, mitochondrial [Triplophysa tibetana]|uniref:START domain-containing protein 1 n=1 Tax=Triplophysa tibetana TaxID=1572043 RepID=A0A5A9PRG2_9TELE|nr:Steroidogenic acute regulatory protein, mitochondrial [Triplophysa tibetana]
MLPAVVKLCCGISYPHVRSMTGKRMTSRRVNMRSVCNSSSVVFCRTAACGRGSVRTGALSPAERGSHHMSCEEALNEALEIVESTDGWKLDLAEKNGDVIYSKALKGNRKVFRLEAELDASPEELYEILFLRVEEMHRWNPSITSIRVLKQVGRNTMVTHEVSAETAGNLIGQRDFLSVRHSSRSGSRVYLGGAATRFESLPPQEGFVRAEDGPTCIILHALPHHSRKSRFIWLLNMDVKGWLPKSLVNKALPRAQLDFTKHLRHHLTGQTQESRT